MGMFEKKLEQDLPRGVPGRAGTLVEAKWQLPPDGTSGRWDYRNANGEVSGIVLGYYLDRVIGRIDNRHIFTCVGSRGGKGVSLIIGNVLIYMGALFVIDPKGEVARVTARKRRAMGQKVVILDPFEENGRYPSGSFNPLDEIDPRSPYAADDAALVAEALIIASEKEPHWTDAARHVVKILILFVLTLDDPADRNLITVRELLTLTHPLVTEMARRAEVPREAALFKVLEGCAGLFKNVVAGGAASIASMSDKERASVLSTARTQTDFLDSQAMAAVLKQSDLRLAELKSSKVTLYLCLPASRMESHFRWLRVIINLALTAFEREKSRPDIPVLMLLDEFPVLGHMKSLEKAAGLMAGFDVKLWVIVQDIGRLVQLYDKSWETFIGNSGILTFWSNIDAQTLEYVSKMLGQTGVRLEQSTGATVGQRLSGASGSREEVRVQRLAAPNELESLLDREQRRILVKIPGQPATILKRIVYYEDKAFVGLFDDWRV